MPKFIGKRIYGASEIEPNARGDRTRVPLSYSQAKLLPPEDVICSLDTTDRGGARSLAKRWYRWFASPHAILNSSRSTPLMRQRAAEAYQPPTRVYATAEIKKEPAYQRAKALEQQLVWGKGLTSPDVPIEDLEVLADAWEEAGFHDWADNFRGEIARRREASPARDHRRKRRHRRASATKQRRLTSCAV